ncbi:50S ribosomal protein L21 [Patescibacteria group bacterium]|jgi:large subunit ribosomal protein L21|nr:50S ribosomal protein L21 [Patescibacteria group bacterium]HPD07779.1 50S ribosomal protein L21 [bacterium]HRT11105.1 50S ribosomal protein L21 [Patescibacteria group bacterium]HRU89938.1 50S ribosomal protein L21 [Patescibacteria group bacterium]
MSKLAIILSGGKQYKVKPGQIIKVEKLASEPGTEVTLETLLLADETSGEVQVGRPFLENGVKAKVIEHSRAPKVRVVKYKNKTRYKKTTGHRQPFTKIEIAEW